MEPWCSQSNPLAGKCREFRRQRDDAAWKTITDQLRQYARQQFSIFFGSTNRRQRFPRL